MAPALCCLTHFFSVWLHDNKLTSQQSCDEGRGMLLARISALIKADCARVNSVKDVTTDHVFKLTVPDVRGFRVSLSDPTVQT